MKKSPENFLIYPTVFIKKIDEIDMKNTLGETKTIDVKTRLACEHTVVSFMAHFDQREFDAMEAYLDPDGTWLRADGAVDGIAGLRELAKAMPAGIRVRHVLSNFRMTRRDASHVTVRSYVTVYRERSTCDASPACFSAPHLVGRYTDELVLTDGAWRIAHKSVIRDFVRD
ncbi:nuclear transport factor 2 family protein [Cupriavidus oxalaticus]|uniref:nuclear transport factor 2 family protein n=1 Tax=Cupriavidus oxalaticus TaxID=96344 RepID=UPI003F741508